MNKLHTMLLCLILAFGLLAGCSQSDNNSSSTSKEEQTEQTSEAEEATVTVTVSQNDGQKIVTEKEVPMEEGAILMDVMKENFDIEEEGGLITSIEGVSAADGEQKSWVYTINGEMANVGANEYELK